MHKPSHSIHVIGVSDDLAELEHLPFANPVDFLHSLHCIVAAERHHPHLAKYAQVISMTPLAMAMDTVAQSLELGDVAILASGDPLFFGIGGTLLKKFSPKQLVFYPATSSIQRACALFKIPWHDATLISLHGRDHIHVPGLLLSHTKSLVLTSGANSPASIAQRILTYLEQIGAEEQAESWDCLVAENLAHDNQRVFTGSLAQAAAETFADLNVLCLKRKEQPHDGQDSFPLATDFSLGLTEEEINHSRGLITKNEVRAATLHTLRLPHHGILWDIGAGSGSVSMEAARLEPGLTIYAVEQKEEELANIKANIIRFGCYNVIPVQGKALACLADLPSPDRIFVGGSGGQLKEIVRVAKERLLQDGTIVINAVLEKTYAQAMEALQDTGFSVSTSRISVCRNQGQVDELVFNPITLISGIMYKKNTL